MIPRTPALLAERILLHTRSFPDSLSPLVQTAADLKFVTEAVLFLQEQQRLLTAHLVRTLTVQVPEGGGGFGATGEGNHTNASVQIAKLYRCGCVNCLGRPIGANPACTERLAKEAASSSGATEAGKRASANIFVAATEAAYDLERSTRERKEAQERHQQFLEGLASKAGAPTPCPCNDCYCDPRGWSEHCTNGGAGERWAKSFASKAGVQEQNKSPGVIINTPGDSCGPVSPGDAE